MKRTILILALASLAVGASGEEVRRFKTQGAARAYYRQLIGRNTDGFKDSTTISGGSFSVITRAETRWHSANTGEYLYSTFSWTQYSRTACGSVLAVPEAKFRVDEMFVYGRDSETGLVVSVGAEIHGGGGNITTRIKRQTLDNLVNSGMAVRGGADAKGGHLLAVKKTAKQRYGARQSEGLVAGDLGRVYVLLYGCTFADGNYSVTPLSME